VTHWGGSGSTKPTTSIPQDQQRLEEAVFSYLCAGFTVTVQPYVEEDL
jgi:hypothetical protein